MMAAICILHVFSWCRMPLPSRLSSTTVASSRCWSRRWDASSASRYLTESYTLVYSYWVHRVSPLRWLKKITWCISCWPALNTWWTVLSLILIVSCVCVCVCLHAHVSVCVCDEWMGTDKEFSEYTVNQFYSSTVAFQTDRFYAYAYAHTDTHTCIHVHTHTHFHRLCLFCRCKQWACRCWLQQWHSEGSLLLADHQWHHQRVISQTHSLRLHVQWPAS